MIKKFFLFIIIEILGAILVLFMIRLPFPIPVLIYWVILGLFIFTIWLFRLKSWLVLLLSFGAFILSATITTIGFNNMAEIVMRISLLGWLVGYIQSVYEYFFRKTS